jgi:hypothetical protein
MMELFQRLLNKVQQTNALAGFYPVAAQVIPLVMLCVKLTQQKLLLFMGLIC